MRSSVGASTCSLGCQDADSEVEQCAEYFGVHVFKGGVHLRFGLELGRAPQVEGNDALGEVWRIRLS